MPIDNENRATPLVGAALPGNDGMQRSSRSARLGAGTRCLQAIQCPYQRDGSSLLQELCGAGKTVGDTDRTAHALFRSYCVQQRVRWFVSAGVASPAADAHVGFNGTTRIELTTVPIVASHCPSAGRWSFRLVHCVLSWYSTLHADAVRVQPHPPHVTVAASPTTTEWENVPAQVPFAAGTQMCCPPESAAHTAALPFGTH